MRPHADGSLVGLQGDDRANPFCNPFYSLRTLSRVYKRILNKMGYNTVMTASEAKAILESLERYQAQVTASPRAAREALERAGLLDGRQSNGRQIRNRPPRIANAVSPPPASNERQIRWAHKKTPQTLIMCHAVRETSDRAGFNGRVGHDARSDKWMEPTRSRPKSSAGLEPAKRRFFTAQYLLVPA